MPFTAEELAAMAAADAEIEATFCLTQEEIVQSRLRDRSILLENMPLDRRRVAAAQKAYYEANREKVAAAKKAYYEANRKKVAAAPADVLKRFRLNHGYTQREFAALIGVSQGCVSLWESRSVKVNWDLVAEKIPDILTFVEVR